MNTDNEETKPLETAEQKAETSDTPIMPMDAENDYVETSPSNGEQRSIKLETTKTTLATRPWTLGAVEVPIKDGNGNTVRGWVAAVIDGSGHPVCCGDTPDMEFIIKMENSYDGIIKMLKEIGNRTAEAMEVMSDFECRKTKSFKFN